MFSVGAPLDSLGPLSGLIKTERLLRIFPGKNCRIVPGEDAAGGRNLARWDCWSAGVAAAGGVLLRAGVWRLVGCPDCLDGRLDRMDCSIEELTFCPVQWIHPQDGACWS